MDKVAENLMAKDYLTKGLSGQWPKGPNARG